MKDLLRALSLDDVNPGGFGGAWCGSGDPVPSLSPIDGRPIAFVRPVLEREYDAIVDRAQEAFLKWRKVPPPVRGETVRRLGNALREKKKELGELVTIEMGKIRVEGEGEVQEMIDICDFAVGLSRQLYGLTIASERPGHRMMEQWHPLGLVGVVTAFNFPTAVWSWNAAVAAVCGDSVVWKPASKTPLCAIATVKLAERICRETGADPAIFSLVVGSGSTIGERLLHDRRIPLISATGSCRMGIRVAEAVGRRLGRTILELGGNNAIVVTPEADLKLAVRAIVFGAIGTAGQRCTSTRRVIVHASIRNELVRRLVDAYGQVTIGNPLAERTLMGPLVDVAAVEEMMRAMARIQNEGGEIIYGGERLAGPEYPGGCYVTPCLAAARADMAIVREETFAPILYVLEYRTFEEAIRIHNDVPQGLSSAIFTRNVLEAERFLSAEGSDCGIANVNIGTSGAEIGGAFGGEKETGGGREAGSDSWKAYMRRQTNTVNWSSELPLAQGIKFGE